MVYRSPGKKYKWVSITEKNSIVCRYTRYCAIRERKGTHIYVCVQYLYLHNKYQMPFCCCCYNCADMLRKQGYLAIRALVFTIQVHVYQLNILLCRFRTVIFCCR